MRESEKIIGDFIKDILNLDDDRIILANQNQNIPKDNDPYVVIENGTKTIFSNRKSNVFDNDLQVFKSVASVSMREQYLVNVMGSMASYNAITIVLAFNSYKSQELQETYKIKLANIPDGIQNISSLEGEGIINRYLITLNLIRSYDRSEEVPFYDSFTFSSEIE